MKEYICKKDFYVEDVKFASVGDHIVLLADNSAIINRTNNKRVKNYPDIIKDTTAFTQVFETKHNNTTELKQKEMVDHPDHYTWLIDKCGIEVIDIIRHLNFNKGNAVKYLLRSGYKSEEGYTDTQKEIEDLKKAIWYIKDEIKLLENKK